jgi:signal transduction histidine kinase
MDPRVTYCVPFFSAAAFIFTVALFAFQRRQVRGGWYLIWVCLAAALWAATEGMLYLGLDVRANLLITYIQYLGIAPLPPMALLFVLTVFRFDTWVTRKQVTVLLGIAAVIILLVWTNPQHHLMFVNTYEITNGPFPMLGLEHGILWWLIIGYHYALLALMSVLLIREMLTSSGFRSSQAGLILVAVSTVWFVNAVYISGHSPVPNMDIGPLAFVLVAVSMSWGFFRYSLLDITPIAKTEIFSGLKDPILVIDQKDRIVDMNPAAASLFDIEPPAAIGRAVGAVLGNFPQLLELPEEARPLETCLTLESRERLFDLHISALRDRRGTQLGRLIVMHDTTQRTCAAEALCTTEKMQGVFEMAGAICHEINQPLMAITGYAELIAMKSEKEGPLHADAKKIVEQVQRLGKITQKLMSITKYETKDYLDRKIIDIEKSSPSPDRQRKPNADD